MGKTTQPSEANLAWREAEIALSEARGMPGGRERYEALKRAGRLRLQAQRLLESEQRPSDN
jgi:hypothetical protein